MRRGVLILAQGFGVGRVPFAPGTFGSVLGFGLLAGLVAPRSAWFFVVGWLLSVAVSVWACGKAEELMGETDPGSVVLDEIVAIPLCCVGWLFLEQARTGQFPGVEQVFARGRWPVLVGVFGLFRLFDIWKPWPVRGIQALPGGWGVTMDDVLAACYVVLVVTWFV